MALRFEEAAAARKAANRERLTEGAAAEHVRDPLPLEDRADTPEASPGIVIPISGHSAAANATAATAPPSGPPGAGAPAPTGSSAASRGAPTDRVPGALAPPTSAPADATDSAAPTDPGPALHVERRTPKATSGGKPAAAAADALIAAVTSRRDPVSTAPTDNIHFHVDSPTRERIAAVKRALHRSRRADLYITALVEAGIEAARVDPAGWRDAARTLATLPPGARAIRVEVRQDLRDALADTAMEYEDDLVELPMAWLARAAFALVLDRLERALEES